jgi:single-strand DNA-binding protein
MDSQLPLVGRLVQDPRQQVTASGAKVTRFRIACSRGRFDRSTNAWVEGEPLYMSVVCWRQLADNVMQTLGKGDAVVVVGRLTYHEWDDPNGTGRQSRYELQATAIGPDLSRYVATLSRPLRELPDAAVPAQADSKPASVDAAAA